MSSDAHRSRSAFVVASIVLALVASSGTWLVSRPDEPAPGPAYSTDVTDTATTNRSSSSRSRNAPSRQRNEFPGTECSLIVVASHNGSPLDSASVSIESWLAPTSHVSHRARTGSDGKSTIIHDIPGRTVIVRVAPESFRTRERVITLRKHQVESFAFSENDATVNDPPYCRVVLGNLEGASLTGIDLWRRANDQTSDDGAWSSVPPEAFRRSRVAVEIFEAGTYFVELLTDDERGTALIVRSPSKGSTTVSARLIRLAEIRNATGSNAEVACALADDSKPWKYQSGPRRTIQANTTLATPWPAVELHEPDSLTLRHSQTGHLAPMQYIGLDRAQLHVLRDARQHTDCRLRVRVPPGLEPMLVAEWKPGSTRTGLAQSRGMVLVRDSVRRFRAIRDHADSHFQWEWQGQGDDLAPALYVRCAGAYIRLCSAPVPTGAGWSLAFRTLSAVRFHSGDPHSWIAIERELDWNSGEECTAHRLQIGSVRLNEKGVGHALLPFGYSYHVRLLERGKLIDDGADVIFRLPWSVSTRDVALGILRTPVARRSISWRGAELASATQGGDNIRVGRGALAVGRPEHRTALERVEILDRGGGTYSYNARMLWHGIDEIPWQPDTHQVRIAVSESGTDVLPNGMSGELTINRFPPDPRAPIARSMHIETIKGGHVRFSSIADYELDGILDKSIRLTGDHGVADIRVTRGKDRQLRYTSHQARKCPLELIQNQERAHNRGPAVAVRLAGAGKQYTSVIRGSASLVIPNDVSQFFLDVGFADSSIVRVGPFTWQTKPLRVAVP